MSVLGYASENKLKNLLIALADGERDIEISRQKLARFNDFTLLSAFERIDRNMATTITSSDILKFLHDNSTFTVTDAEVFNLVRYFENDLTYKLSYKEFSQLLLPCEDTILRNDVLSRKSYTRVGRHQSLASYIESTIVEIIVKEIQLTRELETLKRNLELNYDYTAAAAFRSIDVANRGCLNSFILDEFFKRNSHFMSDFEIMAIIRRIDTEGDAQITYLEFCEFMKADPQVPLYKTASLAELYTPSYYRYRSPYYKSTLYPYEYYLRDYPLYYSLPRYNYYYSPKRTVSKTKVADDNVDLNLKYTPAYRSVYKSVYRSPYRSSSSLASSLARSRYYYSPYSGRYGSRILI